MTKEWVKNCRIGNFERGKLVLNVDNGAWATRIRYAMPEIKKVLTSQPEFAELKEISCQIIPTIKSEKTTTFSRTLSPETQQLLQETIEGLSHPGLREALQRLIKTSP